MYRALRPMLALEQGSIWLMSTPWATRGFFYEAWANGGEAWERVSVKATECSRFSAEWLEREREDWTAEEFQREFMGEFLRDEGSAFDAELVDAAMDDGVAGLELGIVEFREGTVAGAVTGGRGEVLSTRAAATKLAPPSRSGFGKTGDWRGE